VTAPAPTFLVRGQSRKSSFALPGTTYLASWLLANSGASIAAMSGKAYEFLPVVAITGMRLNFSNAVVLALLAVLTSVTVIVMPTPGK
jgi:hypothetical protein